MIVIPDAEKGDRLGESSGVNVPEGLARKARSCPSGGQASRRVVADERSRKPRNVGRRSLPI
jgi:hypothetical protein